MLRGKACVPESGSVRRDRGGRCLVWGAIDRPTDAEVAGSNSCRQTFPKLDDRQKQHRHSPTVKRRRNARANAPSEQFGGRRPRQFVTFLDQKATSLSARRSVSVERDRRCLEAFGEVCHRTRGRSTSSQSRRPSGPRWWPSSRAHGLTASFKDAAERAEKSGFGPTPDSAEVVRLVGCRWLLSPSSWLPSFECMMLCQRNYCSGLEFAGPVRHFQQFRSRGGR